MGSTSLSETQKRYSPVELESLALAWAVGKTHYYIYEAPKVTHYTDSTGVVGLRKKDLSDVKNPRIQCILEKVMPYNISSIHILASQNGISNYLSRHPSSKKCLAEDFSLETPKFRVNIEGQVKIGKNYINRVVRTSPTCDLSDPWLIQISREGENCPQFRVLKELVLLKPSLQQNSRRIIP